MEQEEDTMKRGSKITVTLAAIGVTAVAAMGIAQAANGGDDESHDPITGRALDRASAAALEHTGGGRVTETEVGDEESYYEVEVTTDDGRQIDVQLDKSFNVVSDKVDHEGSDDTNDSR
jgi:uncharacterized membrane protein YkoI